MTKEWISWGLVLCLLVISTSLLACLPESPTSVPVEETIIFVPSEPEIIVKEVVVTEVTTVEVPVEVPVEVIVEVPVKLSDWVSVEELENFLAEDTTNSHVILKANENGVVKFSGQCEDRALMLIDNASDIGKRLFFIPLHRVEYAKWYGIWIGEGRYHTVCGAIVGNNDFYYIEPSNDKCWLALYLD